MTADKNLYRITYSNGSVKLGTRRVLGAVLGAVQGNWYKYPVKVERTPEPGWEDVTETFIKP